VNSAMLRIVSLHLVGLRPVAMAIRHGQDVGTEP
jgi:hypothetical protein